MGSIIRALGSVLIALTVGAGLYYRSLRQASNNVLGNGGFENDGTFANNNPHGSTMLVKATATLARDWQVSAGSVLWSQERSGEFSPKEGDFFVDLLSRDPRGAGGRVGQGLAIDPDQDYKFSLWVGVSMVKNPGPVTFRVTIEDTVTVRFQWVRTYNPSGTGMLWDNFTFLFDTSGWAMLKNASGAIERSGAIYIDAPRELNPGKAFLAIDKAELTLWKSVFRLFAR